MDLILSNRLLPHSKIEPGDITPVNSKHSIIHVPRSMIDNCSLGEFNYSNYPSCYTLQSNIALEELGVAKVQNNPNFNLFGTGTILGFIDSGINYQHPAFLYQDNSTRIHTIWDQTITKEDAPINESFPYGTIYSKEQINKALQQPYPLELVPVTDEIGHGTAIAGLAAGSVDKQNNFSGVASLSELVVVKLKKAKQVTKKFFSIPEDALVYQETDILLAVKFIEAIARALERPLVLCIAVGTNQGGHDGIGPLSSYLDNITALPRCCVLACAGNEGDSKRHYFTEIKRGDPSKEFELNVGEKDKYFFIEFWLQPIQRVALEITSPSGEKVSNLNPGINQPRKHTFVFGTTVICVNNIATESESGDQLIWLRFDKAQSGVWKFKTNNIDKTNSKINAWLPCGDIISNETFFFESDPNITITAPGNAISPITITSYNTLEGGISYFSGKGDTRKGEIKPDLASPGTDLKAPSNKNGYVVATGTGAATALASGIVSLLFEWAIVKGNYTNMTGREVQTWLVRGAKRDIYQEYPNSSWGYGKIDLYGAFEKLTL